ncbi:MAG: EAL domain-containing protein, partial [Proteobacteria bacterium]|nr:EAL domain-containing protein [Pseudomonadota bacterium]
MNAFDGTPTISLNTQRFESSPSVRTIAREIKFAFQPIIHLETGATHGVEALMRGQEALGFKYITDVFDAAYLAGDLAELEARLLERAITEFLASKLPNTLRLFFNLDPRTVVSLGNVLQVIAPVLHKLAMDPKRLCLEI